jgi:hypothetical protein
MKIGCLAWPCAVTEAENQRERIKQQQKCWQKKSNLGGSVNRTKIRLLPSGNQDPRAEPVSALQTREKSGLYTGQNQWNKDRTTEGRTRTGGRDSKQESNSDRQRTNTASDRKNISCYCALLEKTSNQNSQILPKKQREKWTALIRSKNEFFKIQ